MAMQKTPGLVLTFLASGAVAAFRAIGFDGAQASVQGQKVLGVSARAAGDGEYSDADVSGTTLVELGADVTLGASLIADASGKAIPATGNLAIATGATAVTSTAADGDTILTGADLPEFAFADALSAGSNGQVIEALLRR